MTDLDPNSFRNALKATMARFTATASPINEVRAGELAGALRDRIGQLSFLKGPYIETLPNFEKGESLKDLHAAGALHPAWSAFGTNAPGV